MRELTIRKLNNYPFNFFNDLDEDFKTLFHGTNNQRVNHLGFNPAFEIVEHDHVTLLSTDLPGVKKDDIKIEFKEGYLTLSGERKSKHTESHYSEIKYGKFEKSFKLPKNLDIDKVEAQFHDGVLTLAIPRKEQEKSKEIEIKIDEDTSLFEKYKA